MSSDLKCALGEDCNMTIAYMLGAEKAKDTITDLRAELEDALADANHDKQQIKENAAQITALRGEVERLRAMNALMSHAAFPTAEEAREAEEWIKANPTKPLSEYCSPGGLLVKQLRAENERLRAALREIAGLGVVCASDTALIALRDARAALEEK